MKTILETKELSFSFPIKKEVLKEITLTIAEGELVLLCGRNGSGKSLLLRSLKGLLSPIKGTILIEGRDLSRHPKERNRAIGLVFQDAETQMVGQSVERDLRFGLENLKIDLDEQAERVAEVSRLLNLSHLLNERPRSLSGGEQRRVAIGGVLVMAPKILLLDEPFANLDWDGVRQVLSSLLRLKESGVTIVVATHEIEKIYPLSDSLILLEGGEVVAQGSPPKLLEVVEEYGVRRPSLEEIASWSN
ncbi:MAG: ABC transporter ATP-binding protein [Spirochaetales bacterium]|jgi:biotin transport system ATP-binding protein|nr:ABC transporter ATP-binding protein [Spirochaetales bacterium]